MAGASQTPAGWYETMNGPAFWDGSSWSVPPGKMTLEPGAVLPGWHRTEKGLLWWTGSKWLTESPLPEVPPTSPQGYIPKSRRGDLGGTFIDELIAFGVIDERDRGELLETYSGQSLLAYQVAGENILRLMQDSMTPPATRERLMGIARTIAAEDRTVLALILKGHISSLGSHPSGQAVGAFDTSPPQPPPPQSGSVRDLEESKGDDFVDYADWSPPPARGFMEAMEVCLGEKYATASGRASRSEFWWFVLGSFLLEFVIGFAYGLIAEIFGIPLGFDGFFSLVVFIALFIPTIAVGVRRMHDAGYHGGLAIVPFVNLILALQPGTPSPNKYDMPAVREDWVD